MAGFDELLRRHRIASLPEVEKTIDRLWDVAPEGKALNLSFNINIDRDMLELIRKVTMHEALPYNNNHSAFGRDAIMARIESLKEYLDHPQRMLLYVLRQQQTRLTNERYVVGINANLDTQVTNLRVWTASRTWTAVVDDMKALDGEIAIMPPEWQARTAYGLVTNAGLRNLRRTWARNMDPKYLQEVEDLFKKWQSLAEQMPDGD